MQKLRDARRGKLISIEGLADSSKVSTKTIVEIELGRQVPRLRTIKKLSEALNVDPASIEEFSDAMFNPEEAAKKLAA